MAYYQNSQNGNQQGASRGGTSYNGYNAAPQNAGQQGYGQKAQQPDQERTNFTPVIYDAQCNRLEDLQMTVILGLAQNLNFNKFLSTNGNICVGVRAELTVGDKLISDLLGAQMVKPDHKYALQFILAGYTAKRFLEHVPNCTKSLVFVLKDFNVSNFDRRDGTKDFALRANCVGMQIVHSSSRFKPSEVKACNLQPSAPFSVYDSTNGADTAGNGNAPQQQYKQPAPQQQGFAQPGGFNTVGNIPGVTNFVELENDEELPF